jgi:hypothetical protein
VVEVSQKRFPELKRTFQIGNVKLNVMKHVGTLIV